jgi:hypothetical protein
MLKQLSRALRPRFSLAAAFLVVTLSAVMLWYWYRVPFEIVHTPAKGRTETETVHRTWDGAVRHGPRSVSIDGQPRALEHYREGIADGSWEWRGEGGQTLLSAEYKRGQLTETKPSSECDERLARHLAEGTIDNPRLVQQLVSTVQFDYGEIGLQDAVNLIGDELDIPISCLGLQREPDFRPPDAPRPVRQIDIPVAAVGEAPLIVVLGRMLQPHGLVCDYRYGLLWVIPREESIPWKDPTGVSEIVPPVGSALESAWERPIDSELIECPLRPACLILSRQVGDQVEFDWAKLPQIMYGSYYPGAKVSFVRSRHPFKHCLGLILFQTGCRARLEGEKLAIEMQPEHPDAPYY